MTEKQSNKVIKSVSFNLTNQHDAEMLKAIKRRNFSGYVKKLIMSDIRSKNETEGGCDDVAVVAATEDLQPPIKQESARDRLEKLKRQKSEHKPAQKVWVNRPKS